MDFPLLLSLTIFLMIRPVTAARTAKTITVPINFLLYFMLTASFLSNLSVLLSLPGLMSR